MPGHPVCSAHQCKINSKIKVANSAVSEEEVSEKVFTIADPTANFKSVIFAHIAVFK